MRARDVRPMRREDAAEVAGLHCSVMPDGFLAQLGPSVLVHAYAAAIGAPGVVALVAARDHEIGGFLLATTDTRALFRRILGRGAPRLALAVLGAVWRRPAALGRVLETVRYPARRDHGGRPPEAELISIGVRSRYRDRGYGTALIETLSRQFASGGVRAYSVSVYSDNTQANGLYRRLGFEFTHRFEMYGRSWTGYRFVVPGGDRAGDERRRPLGVSGDRIPLG